MSDLPAHGPGWYDEPSMPGTLRYWDGQQFTGAVAPKPPGPVYNEGPSVATIALGVAAGIALVLFMLFWFGGGFAD